MNTVDKEAREKIERLERRLEGAHLTPGVWQMTKQALQSILSWNGWEVISIGFFIIFGIFLLGMLVFGFHGGCQAREVNRYQPTCDALGGTFTEVSSHGQVVCTTDNQVISVDPDDLNDTEVFHLNTEEDTEAANHE